MSTRTRRPWPVSRTTARLIAAGAAVAALAWFAPAMRGGLFLLALAGCACGYAALAGRRQ